MATEPNWTSGAIEHDFYVVMVDPLNLTTIRGELKNVNRDGTFTLKYYGDTRAGLTLTTTTTAGESDGWDGSAALRLVHTVGEWSETLFTGYVTDTSYSDESGMRTTSYTLNSVLYGLSVEYTANPYTVGKDAMALDVLTNIFEHCSKPYTIMPDCTDYRFGKATVYASDKTLLNVVYDVADKATDRLNVDAMGIIVLKKYTSPAYRSPDIELNTSDTKAVTIAPISYSDNKLEKPARAVLVATQGDEQIVGIAQLGSDSEYSRGRRGYLLDSYYTSTDMEPFTQERANTVAQQRLNGASDLTITIELETMYMPMQAGWIVRLNHLGDMANYMITVAALDLGSWLWKLTMKKVSE